MPAAKKTTVTKTKNVSVKKAPVKDTTPAPEPVKRPGRPPKANKYSFTIVSNGNPIKLSFESHAHFEKAFLGACYKPASGRPVEIVSDGKQYFFAKVDYVVRDV